MTSISNSVSSVSNTVQTEKTQANEQLSAATKAKLEALGIDPETVSSESQAQSLIANAQSASFKSMVSNDEQNSNSTEETYLQEAKSLASSLGITYSSDDTINDILSSISNKLNQMMASAAMNPSIMQMVQTYQTQLEQISSSYSQAQAASMYSSVKSIS